MNSFRNERGMALIWVTACVLVIAGIVFSGITRMHAHEQKAEVGFTVDGRAYSVARAGLVDALAWMRRHPTQPVLDFEPDLDLDADIPVDETDDPNLGLVRTFEISPGLWGRYVVRRGRPMDPFTDLNGNGLYDDGEPFVDLLAEEIWPDTIEDGTFPPEFTAEAAPIVSDYRAQLDALTELYDGDTSSKLYERDAADLKKDYEKLLITLAQGYPSISPPGLAKKLLDSAAVQTVEQGAGTGDGEWTPAMWTRDVAEERGQPGAGTVWRIESRGTVFRMSNSNQPLGSGANQILGTANLATEVRRLGVSPPASAAICAPHAQYVTVGTRSRIRAEALGVAVDSTAYGLDMSGGEVIAPTSVSAVPDYDGSLRGVFGVDWSQLRSMADVSTTAAKTKLYQKINPYTLVTIDGNVTFGLSMPLRGKGILAVKGNVTIAAGSKSFFTGVLYVDGNVVIDAPAYIQGTIVCTGSVVLEGTGADFVDVEHDPNIVSDLLSVMGQYRITRAIYVPDEQLEGWSLSGSTGLVENPETPSVGEPWTNFWCTGGVSVDPDPDGGTGAADWWLDR